MSQTEGLVDLIEIYHARQVRDQIVSQLRRLRVEARSCPDIDTARRIETMSYYEALLITVAELLHTLGDDTVR